MMIRHHPSEETLARHAAGMLEVGLAVVLATHMAGCPTCRAHGADFEAVGGALLEELPPTSVAPEALARTLALIDAPEPAPAPRPQMPMPTLSLGGFELPATLRACEIGRWRWLAPGIRWSRVEAPRDPKAHVMLLRVGANTRLPEHGHTGTEFTQVISGSFSDRHGRYCPGDLLEADAEVDHQPIVDPDRECICVVALEGQVRFRGFLGRLLQPFVGF